MAVKNELFVALSKAAVDGDRARLRSLILQAASHMREGYTKRTLQALADRRGLTPLPRGTDSFVHELADVELGDLVLADELATDLRTVAREHGARAALLGRGLYPRCRLLFVGPPGNGKTSAAAALCGLIGIPAYGVAFWNVTAGHLGETGSNLSKLMPLLDGGAALVFDEIDSLAPVRIGGGGGADKERNAIVNTLLALLDRSRDGLLIATTNRRDMIDPALLRRFDAELTFPPPSDEQASRLVAALCDRFDIRRPVIVGDDGASYDAIAKAIETHARRAVLDACSLREASA